MKTLSQSYHTMSLEQLKEAFEEAALQTTDGLARMGAIVRAAEDRGLDLHEFVVSGTMLDMLRGIGRDRILPSLVHRYMGDMRLLEAVSRYAIEDQKKLDSDDPVAVAEWDGEGFTHRMVQPSLMNARQVKQVFGTIAVRTLSEQERYIREHQPAAIKVEDEAVEIRRGCIVVKKPVKITVKQLEFYLKAAKK